MEEKFLRLPLVMDFTGMRRSAIYARVNEGTFPKPVTIHGRSVAWIKSEVDAWIRETIAASK
jgi:prophage regulatory protein